MTAGNVHHPEMPAPDELDDRAMEALLGGRSVAAAGEGPLAQFADDLRVAVSGPPPAPAPQLARVLAEGFSIDSGQLATAGAAHRPRPSPGDRPTRRRRKMTISELLGALGAKLAGLGVAAKVALGAGLATASVAGAGAAGVLPPAAQHAVAAVVNTTPLHMPDSSDDDATPDETDRTDANAPAPSGAPGAGDDGATTDGGDQPADNHGACVSDVAQSAPQGGGGVHGQAVSEAAKSCPKATHTDHGDNNDDDTATTTTTTLAEPDGDTTHVSGDDHGQSGVGHGQSGVGHGKNGQGQGESGQHG